MRWLRAACFSGEGKFMGCVWGGSGFQEAPGCVDVGACGDEGESDGEEQAEWHEPGALPPGF